MHREVDVDPRKSLGCPDGGGDAPATASLRRRHRTVRRIVVIALFFGLLTLPGSASAAADLRFGIHTPGEPLAGTTNEIDRLEHALGRRIAIVSWFQNWDDVYSSQVQPEVFRAVIDKGRTPLVTWEPWRAKGGVVQGDFTLTDIAGGAYDDYIARFAQGLKALGARVYLRPMHEMNGDWYPWGGVVNGNSAALFQRAWRHMHDVFVAEGATNVKWVWSPLQEDVPLRPENRFERYYPGGGYVDVLALDGYNFGANFPQYRGWRSFTQIFRDAYRRMSRLGHQPIWVAEVGSAAEGGSKAAWVRDMFRTARRMRRLKAVVWMDVSSKEEGDWRVLQPLGVAAAFRAAVGGLRRNVLRISRAGARTTVRWSSMNAEDDVEKWRVYLNGRRVRTVAGHRARIVRTVVTRRGLYVWTVRGFDAHGQQVARASKLVRL